FLARCGGASRQPGRARRRDAGGARALRLAGQRARAAERPGRAGGAQPEARRGPAVRATVAVRREQRARGRLPAGRRAADVRRTVCACRARADGRPPRTRRRRARRHASGIDEAPDAARHLAVNEPLVGISIPNFWLGPLLAIVFSIMLGWLPVSGWG